MQFKNDGRSDCVAYVIDLTRFLVEFGVLRVANDCGALRVANKKKYTNVYPFSGLNDNMLASLKTTRELITCIAIYGNGSLKMSLYLFFCVAVCASDAAKLEAWPKISRSFVTGIDDLTGTHHAKQNMQSTFFNSHFI